MIASYPTLLTTFATLILPFLLIYGQPNPARVVRSLDLAARENHPLRSGQSAYGGSTQGLVPALMQGPAQGEFSAYSPQDLQQPLTHADLVRQLPSTSADTRDDHLEQTIFVVEQQSGSARSRPLYLEVVLTSTPHFDSRRCVLVFRIEEIKPYLRRSPWVPEAPYSLNLWQILQAQVRQAPVLASNAPGQERYE